MNFHWAVYLSLFLALWSAVVGGVFSAFSEFVMSGLLRAAPAGGIESMQHINRTVLRTQFVAGILVIPLLSIAFAIYAWRSGLGDTAWPVLLAPVVFVPTVLLLTMFGNVPMNNRLEALDPNSAEAATYWIEYGRVWTRLNHVRTLGSIVTAGLYMLGALALVLSNRSLI